MLHVLYIITNISCPRTKIKNRGMPCNLYVYGVNRRSENFLLLSDLLLREEGVSEADISV